MLDHGQMIRSKEQQAVMKMFNCTKRKKNEKYTTEDVTDGATSFQELHFVKRINMSAINCTGKICDMYFYFFTYD
jgi:hypothetical protein